MGIMLNRILFQFACNMFVLTLLGIFFEIELVRSTCFLI